MMLNYHFNFKFKGIIFTVNNAVITPLIHRIVNNNFNDKLSIKLSLTVHH